MILLTYNLNNMKSVKNVILIILLLLAFPTSAFMAEVSNQGTITINVYDENNKPYMGNWYLHQGTNEKGLVLRNGSSGETFSFKEGTYFLRVYKKDSTHPYNVIYSNNPQTLTADETITFNVQYFKTQEEMNNASSSSTTETSSTDTDTTDISDTSSSDTNAESSSDSDETTTDLASTDTSSEDESETETATGTTYSRTYMGPRVTYDDLHDSDTAASSGSSAGSGSASLPLELAQTGSPAFLLLIFSGLLGRFAARRKK